MSHVAEGHALTIPKLMEQKAKTKITMVTCYDFAFAKLIDQSKIDVVLVGDSLGNVVLGYENTIPVTLDETIHHAKAVRRGLKRAAMIVDMPFGSYQCGVDDAVRNAVQVIKETGAQAVKLEGSKGVTEVVGRLTACGIPVVGHIGLTPQSIHQLGGYRIQGRQSSEYQRLLDEAEALEKAGVCMLVLELVPQDLAARLTQKLKIPTIGIGAGSECDGQVLVLHDLLGFNADFNPKFLKK